jgi:archaellin
MEIQGAVLGLSPNETKPEQVSVNLALTIPTATVDTSAIVVNFWDDSTHAEGITPIIALSSGSTERGNANILEQGEQFTLLIPIPAGVTVGAYDTFAIQIIPPTGAVMTIQRTMPSSLRKIMDLR